MAEIFKPRENMQRRENNVYVCLIKVFPAIQDGVSREEEDVKYALVCEGGPSLIWGDGAKWEFIISGIGYHRLDGPALSTGKWYFHGKHVTDEIRAFAKENDIDLENLTDADKVMIALKFG